jgi:SAM-dependent methyltransferase
MAKTNWNEYYLSPFKIAKFTRKVTTGVLIKFIKSYCPFNDNSRIIEFGGGNSCFFGVLNTEFKPEKYIILDNNMISHKRFLKENDGCTNVYLVNGDALYPPLKIKADLVFSVGLIEHFTWEDTVKIIDSHLDVLCKDGILILSFPTPTLLYKLTRKSIELTGKWIFHDERPIKLEDIITILKDKTQILDTKIIWPIFLTQAMVVVRKK